MSSVCAFALGLLSCRGAPEGTVTLVTGEETEVLSRAPAPTTLIAEKVSLDGTRTEIRRTPLPAETLDLGELDRAEAGAIAVTGLDAAGKTVVRGETLFVQWGALEDTVLEVFIQRTGEFARLPRGPAAFDATLATMLVSRYVLATNGTASAIYDLLALKPIAASPTLPRPAKSVATFDTTAVLIDEAGATTFDLSDGATAPLDAPTGGTFGEVAGGIRVDAPDGSQYIVGATRTAGGSSARVLMVNADGKASFAGLTAPREGACATFVEGRGLVVFGGSDTAAGAEVLAPGATLATPLPVAPDAVRGCSAATLDNAHIAIVGGDGVRVLDLGCTTACAPAAWIGTMALTRAEVLPLAPDAVFVLGDDAGGATHAYRATKDGVKEIALKNGRRGARMVRTPTGAITVLGGGIGIEQYLE